MTNSPIKKFRVRNFFIVLENPALDAGFIDRYAFDQKILII